MGPFLVMVALVLGGLAVLWLIARRDVTLCVLEVRGGKVEVVSGSIAPGLLRDLRDVLARPKVKEATVRLVRAGDRARIEASGVRDEGQMQRLRNVVGNVKLAQAKGATRSPRRTPKKRRR